MKKGSLNMSINTIVVLVLAMTLLGFGLMFVRGIFSKATSQFEQVGGDVEKLLKEKLMEGNARLTFQTDTLEIKKGQKKVVYFAIRNDLDNDKSFSINGNGQLEDDGSWNGGESVVKCFANDAGTETPSDDINFRTIGSIKIKSNEVKVFPLTVEVKSSATAETTYYCAMVIKDPDGSTEPYARVDFTVYVKS